MIASSFLRFVWPDTGYYCIAIPVNKNLGGYKHHIFDTIDAAATAAMSLDSQGINVYYCMSTLKERKVVDGDGRTHYRTTSNLNQLQVFFFEMDIAKPGEWDTLTDLKKAKTYPTRQDAIAALKEFTKIIGWPQPTVVSSGFGFHIYFPLDRSVPTSTFAPVAKQLKQVAKATGFKLDPGAIDMNRVYRVVGTHNYKLADNPQPVELVKASVAYSPDALAASLNLVATEMGVALPAKSDLPDYLDFGGEGNVQTTYDGPPAKFELLLKCAAIKTVVDAGGDVPYNHWWHVGQVVRHAENGREHYHELSKNSPNYSKDYTDQVLDRFERNNVGPSLCTTIGEHTSDCDECQYRGSIKSPIVLGRESTVVASPPPQIEVEQDDGTTLAVTIPDAPYPFVRSAGKVFVSTTKKDGDKYDKPILDYDMFPIKRVYYESQNREHVMWKVVMPLEGTHTIVMPSADMYDKKQFTTNLTNAGVYVTNDCLDHVRNYMVAYIQELQKHAQRDKLFSRLGWRENNTEFVLGETLYTPTGAYRCDIEKENMVAKAIRTDGTLDEWKRIVNMYNHPKFLCHQFAFATAFGAPLMAFTGIAGGVINLLGRSGEGKSTVQRLVNSVWGHPLELMIPADNKGSTYNAKISLVATMGNLPVCAEEITDMPPDALGALVYSISHGKPKVVLTADRKLLAAFSDWCLSMLSSSNSSINEKLANVEGAAAKAYRVLELRVPSTTVYNKNDFERKFEMPMRRNYGHAGRVYIEFITQNRAQVEALLHKVMKRLDYLLQVTAEERVWSALAATNIAGFMVAKLCGLHTMSAKPLFDYIVTQIRHMRERAVETTQTAPEAAAEYLNQFVQGIIVVDEWVPESRGANTTLVEPPRRAVIGRYDRVSGQVWIASGLFKAWCVKNGRVYQDTVNELYEKKIVTNKNILKTLGAGTEFKTGQVKCILIDTNAEAFAGSEPELERIKSIGPKVVPITSAKLPDKPRMEPVSLINPA